MRKNFSYPAALVLASVAYLVNAADVLAHAVVTGSSLRGQPLQPQKETEVILHFNSGVELSLSKFDLVRKGDTHEPVSIRHGAKPGQILVAIPPLGPGNYAIHYKVFAADGHLTEDIIRFRVDESPEP